MKTLVMGETCESAQFRVNERRLSASKWPDRLKRERGNDAIDATVAQFSKVETWLAFSD